MTDKEVIEKVNSVLEKIDVFFHRLEPSLKNAISRDMYFAKHPEIKDRVNYNFSLSGDDIINQQIPYNVAGCTGRAKLFAKYAMDIGLTDFFIVLTVKTDDIKNKRSGKMIDGHQLVAIKLSDGLHMIDPGAGKTYEAAQKGGICKIGEDIDAVGNNKNDYRISAILKPKEYDYIKTYKQMENLYLKSIFSAATDKLKEQIASKGYAGMLSQNNQIDC